MAQFTRTAEAASQEVIRTYSTSFGLATRLLGTRHRSHVRNIYALVRVADEIVDGVASQAGLSLSEQQDALDRYMTQTHIALGTGYSSDLVVHAFAQTARQAGINEDLTTPFFASMRADLGGGGENHVVFDRAQHSAYVYGSAEVVGLMCLRVFTRESTLNDAERHILEHGARRLGAAFQNINFLRDLGDDTGRLGRSYLGASGALTEEQLRYWIGEIRSQLSDAAAAIPLLPHDARAAVRSALALFANLTERIAQTPAKELSGTRIRVPDPIKAVLACSAIFKTLRERRR
nr:squalene/phytoene synthase family protein [Rarobacter faecitabidus]